MEDRYLWDRSGTPDPEVQRLEAVLGRLRHAAPPPRLPERVVRGRVLRAIAPALATAAAVLLMIGITWQSTRSTSSTFSTFSTSSSWEVIAVAGRPQIESAPIGASARISVGQTLVTDNVAKARLTVATIGQVTVDPNTRVRLVETRQARYRLALDRGTLHAVITAPPGQFVVNTPSAVAVDLGCAYTLTVDENGAGLLSVTAGWVALDLNGRESLVPVGASARIDPKLGPGMPWYEDADEEFRRALDVLDFDADRGRRASALALVLDRAQNGHAVTLWHLIKRVDASDRAAVIDALADQVPMPAGVTREDILRLDADALDLWWNALGLGDASWWRNFTAPFVSR